jgi:hypothetical protein
VIWFNDNDRTVRHQVQSCGVIEVVAYELAAIFSQAVVTISANPSVVARPESSDGLSHRASASSSFSLISPASQRAANGKITKCRSTRPFASRPMTWRFKTGLLADLAYRRLGKRLAEFDDAPGKRVETCSRRLRAPDNEQAAVSEDGGAHRNIRPCRIRSLLRADAGQ